MDRSIALENRTLRLEKHVFEQEEPILKIVDKHIRQIKNHIKEQLIKLADSNEKTVHMVQDEGVKIAKCEKKCNEFQRDL